MLRQSYMNKYKEKSKFDDDRFTKEDDEYLLKEMRPVKANVIRKLPKHKLEKFIDDVLTDRYFTKILYDSNANAEIKKYNKVKKSLEMTHEKLEPKKEKNEPSSVVKKRSRREAYLQIRTEVDNFKKGKEDYKNYLEKKNNENYLLLKNYSSNDKNAYFEPMKENRIEGFKKSFNRIRNKLKALRGNPVVDEKTNETAIINDPFYTEDSKVDLPDIKLNLRNVFSRLYHNAVLLEENKKVKEPKIITNTNKPNAKNIKFKVKNVLKSTNGKEFTIKITDNIIRKCFNKYSGGPEVIDYLKEQLNNNNEDINESELREDQVNFYNIITEEGNTFLHLATMDNLYELVKYFTEKGANCNIQNNNGDTPLHIAARENYNLCIKYLLKGNAALDIMNNNKEIPFDYFDNIKKKEFGLEKVVVVMKDQDKKQGTGKN